MRRSWPTRPRFSDNKNLKALAKENVQTTLGYLRKWWVQKYSLPPYHELFESRSIPELLLEWYEDLYDEKTTLERQLETEKGESGNIRNRLNEVLSILEGGPNRKTGDRLIDYWEDQLARGEEPDLDMKEEDLPDGY